MLHQRTVSGKSNDLNLNNFQVSKKYLHSPKLWYWLLLCEWVNGWVRVCLVLPASWWWVVKEFIVCWYLEPRCTSHVGAEAQKLQKGLPCLGGASVAADGRTWEIGRGGGGCWAFLGAGRVGEGVGLGEGGGGGGVVGGLTSCLWPPGWVSNSGIYGRGLGIQGQVPDPVVDNIHEGLALSSTQEFTAPPTPPLTTPATITAHSTSYVSIEIPVLDTSVVCCRIGLASFRNSEEVCLHFPRISGIIREIK